MTQPGRLRETGSQAAKMFDSNRLRGLRLKRTGTVQGISRPTLKFAEVGRTRALKRTRASQLRIGGADSIRSDHLSSDNRMPARRKISCESSLKSSNASRLAAAWLPNAPSATDSLKIGFRAFWPSGTRLR